MNINVLVIDDRWNERQSAYFNLADSVSKTIDCAIEISFLEQPSAISHIFQNKNFSLVLVDAVLEQKWDRDFDLNWALNAIPPDILIALVSSQWGNTNPLHINAIWERQNCKGFFHWHDIDQSTGGDFNYAKHQLIKLITEAKQFFRIDFSEGRDSPIRILHISDLQIGGISNPDRVKLEANIICEKFHQISGGNPPQFIALTGDVTEHGLPEEFDEAKIWLENLCSRLGFSSIPRERILICPGNHDVNIALGAASRFSFKKDKEKSSRKMTFEDRQVSPSLLTYALKPYYEFSQSVSDHTRIDDTSWIEGRFRNLGILFYGLQTAYPNPNGFPFKKVEPKTLDRIKTYLSNAAKDSKSNPLIIGLGHHSPLAAAPAEMIENISDMMLFSSTPPATNLFLYGHSHEAKIQYTHDGQQSLVRATASTLAKGNIDRKEDTLRGFNLYELHRVDGKIHSMKTRIYSWISQNLKQTDEQNFRISQSGSLIPDN